MELYCSGYIHKSRKTSRNGLYKKGGVIGVMSVVISVRYYREKTSDVKKSDETD